MFQSVDDAHASSRSCFDWHDVRFIGAVAGRCALYEHRAGDEGKAPVHACRLCSVSTRLAVVVGPVIGNEGDAVIASFDEFGILRGRISRKLPSGFVMDLMLGDAERNRLGASVTWKRQKVLDQVPERRGHKRILPLDPRSVLTLADGSHRPCCVIDISRSGIAVSAELRPGLGTPLAVGKLVGRVVRHIDVGFAMRFIQLQEFDRLETLMAPAAAWNDNIGRSRPPGREALR